MFLYMFVSAVGSTEIMWGIIRRHLLIIRTHGLETV